MQYTIPQANPIHIWWIGNSNKNDSKNKSVKLLTLKLATTNSVHMRPGAGSVCSINLNWKVNLRTGRVHDIKIKLARLARSSSTLARYRWSPVVFLSFFAILIKIIDERVSLMTSVSNRRYNPLILYWGFFFCISIQFCQSTEVSLASYGSTVSISIPAWDWFQSIQNKQDRILSHQRPSRKK